MSKYVATIRVGLSDAVVKRTITGCASSKEAWLKARKLYQVYPTLVLVSIGKKKRRS